MLRLLLLGCLASLTGCTFYTACPTDNGNNNNPTTNTGATANGGSDSGSGGDGGGTGPGNPDDSIIDGGEAPTGEWVNVTSNLAGLDSECGNMSLVSAKPDEDYLIAGVAAQGLWSSINGGESWERLEGGDPLSNRTTAIIYDPADPNTMWECGNYGSDGGVYRSVDGGRTFQRLGDITHNELVSIDFTDPERKTLLAGSHEQNKKLYLSTDGGETWTDIGENVPDEADASSFPLVLNATTFLLGVGGYGPKLSGVYRSTDQGKTWELMTEDNAGYTRPLVHTSGDIYWPAPFNKGLGRSTDLGETWDALPIGNGLIGLTPIELPDGRIAALREDDVVVSADAGETWRVVTTDIPQSPGGLTYSVQRKAFFTFHWDCLDAVPEEGVLRYDWDYETETE